MLPKRAIMWFYIHITLFNYVVFSFCCDKFYTSTLDYQLRAHVEQLARVNERTAMMKKCGGSREMSGEKRGCKSTNGAKWVGIVWKKHTKIKWSLHDMHRCFTFDSWYPIQISFFSDSPESQNALSIACLHCHAYIYSYLYGVCLLLTTKNATDMTSKAERMRVYYHKCFMCTQTIIKSRGCCFVFAHCCQLLGKSDDTSASTVWSYYKRIFQISTVHTVFQLSILPLLMPPPPPVPPPLLPAPSHVIYGFLWDARRGLK